MPQREGETAKRFRHNSPYHADALIPCQIRGIQGYIFEPVVFTFASRLARETGSATVLAMSIPRRKRAVSTAPVQSPPFRLFSADTARRL